MIWRFGRSWTHHIRFQRFPDSRMVSRWGKWGFINRVSYSTRGLLSESKDPKSIFKKFEFFWKKSFRVFLFSFFFGDLHIPPPFFFFPTPLHFDSVGVFSFAADFPRGGGKPRTFPYFLGLSQDGNILFWGKRC